MITTTIHASTRALCLDSSTIHAQNHGQPGQRPNSKKGKLAVPHPNRPFLRKYPKCPCRHYSHSPIRCRGISVTSPRAHGVPRPLQLQRQQHRDPPLGPTCHRRPSPRPHTASTHYATYSAGPPTRHVTRPTRPGLPLFIRRRGRVHRPTPPFPSPRRRKHRVAGDGRRRRASCEPEPQVLGQCRWVDTVRL